jgi:hypothetical protein
MKLYFEDRYGRLRPISDVETKEDVSASIANFLNQYNYKSYYIRQWISEGEDCCDIVYDVGSHTEFFRVRFDNYDKAQAFLKA